MDICYNERLVMPSGYSSMNQEEMIYVEGGAGSVAVLAAIKWIRSHSNPINLGRDSSFRVAVYKAIWTVF